MPYCKRGNICGALIFTENSSSANSKTRENIADVLYAHLNMQELCIDHTCVDANG